METFLRSISIRHRLLGGMLVVSVLIMALGIWATVSYKGLQSQTDELLDAQASVSRDTGVILAAFDRIQRYEQSVLLNGNNPNEAADHKGRWDKEVAATTSLLSTKTDDADRAKHLAEGAAGLAAYAKELAPVLQQVVEAKLDSTAGYAYAQRSLPELEKARTTFSAMVKETEDRITAERAETKRVGTIQSNIRLGGALLVLAIFFGLMWTVARSIAKPLVTATACAQRIARGDLSENIVDNGKDEVSAFVRALGDMQQSLRDIVGQVRASADSISTASAEVASGNLDLSQRTEHAASNLQETAASLHELTGNVRHSAESAAQATQLASSASQVAERGGKVVAQVVKTMDEINASSRKIADITGVIDGIAFQTNILALNAAVEAARAGEQGRGFAVVAAEVRSLAQRSAEAAKEIKSLIGTSVDRVENGARQVQDAGSTMTEIVGSVRRVNDIIGEITAASSEQSTGIGQVNTAVTQLDQMTQQNAALVEESAAAAESLKDQAQRLMKVVATFRLDNTGSLAVAPVAPPAPVVRAAPAPVRAAAPAPHPQPAPAPAPVAASAPVAAPATAEDEWTSF
ncbi:MAG TPA: methyl-accepting chemotaxis protein [Ideonella sp.]|uniref:methyl-accepting chemotaxis protein n=1 Tax=Ideonella sp. TaxID=1929293 RepID=UPI002E35D268|nr:methyl-accepting chemotaxis protein [Ideonella sp.]HEX5683562.1 methyl-accepting chemotaxis protein [Ideonella sp.]